MVLSDTTNMPALFAKHQIGTARSMLTRCLPKRRGANCSTVSWPTRRSYFPFPAVGKIVTDGAGYTFVPAA